MTPGSVFSTAQSGPGGSAIGFLGSEDSFDESIATARASLPGPIGSYSHAGGFSPSFMTPPSGPLTAEATARTVTHWLVTASDPSITTVGIDVFAFYDGTLVTGDFAGVAPNGLIAAVETQLNAFDANGQIYGFQLNAQLEDSAGLSASSGWVGSFTNSSSEFGSVKTATVNYSDFFNDAFTVNIGDTFAWESILATSGFATAAFELWAIADFFNTGGFELSVNTPGVQLVQVNAVPLPAGLSLLLSALGITPLCRRHRPRGAF